MQVSYKTGDCMEYGKVVSESIAFAREALWGKWVRWILLIISTIIFPLMGGYEIEIFKGKKPAPEPGNWVHMFINGLKLFVAAFIYFIPILIILFLLGGASLLSLVAGGKLANPTAIAAGVAGLIIALLFAAVVWFILALFWTMGMVRLGKTEKFGEAFNFNAISATIGKIGWGSYIVALIILWILLAVYFVILSAIMMIPYVGWLIWLILLPPVIIFSARYMTMIYESAGEEAPPGT
jgi:Protein of unknown function (DUF4013)